MHPVELAAHNQTAWDDLMNAATAISATWSESSVVAETARDVGRLLLTLDHSPM